MGNNGHNRDTNNNRRFGNMGLQKNHLNLYLTELNRIEREREKGRERERERERENRVFIAENCG
jgi:hypothetical protein